MNFSNGPQLFTWPTTAPTFVPGYYTGFTPSGGEFATISDVTISSVTTTPEPTSLALLDTGLVGLIPIVRRRWK